MYLYNGVVDELGLVVNPTGTLVRLTRRVLERPDIAQFLRRVVAVVARVRLALTVLLLLRIVRSDQLLLRGVRQTCQVRVGTPVIHGRPCKNETLMMHTVCVA